MKLIYVTLNTTQEAQFIGKALLENNLANCVNYFPITCMYKWEGEITEEPEVVLIIKTLASKYKEVQTLIKKYIDYTNFIGELDVAQVNDEFTKWLKEIVGE